MTSWPSWIKSRYDRCILVIIILYSPCDDGVQSLIFEYRLMRLAKERPGGTQTMRLP